MDWAEQHPIVAQPSPLVNAGGCAQKLGMHQHPKDPRYPYDVVTRRQVTMGFKILPIITYEGESNIKGLSLIDYKLLRNPRGSQNRVYNAVQHYESLGWETQCRQRAKRSR